MNKSDFTTAVADHTAVDPKIVAQVLGGMEDVIATTVKKGEKITVTGLLSFERVDHKARKGRNPSNGESIRIKASKGIRVSPGLRLRKVVNGESPAPKLGKPAAPKPEASARRTVKATGASKTIRRPAAKKTPAASTAATTRPSASGRVPKKAAR